MPPKPLSGGESQRIQLAATLGGQLTGAIYVLDEPTIGLHPHNTQQLLAAVRKLQQAPNTVIVVEHDPLFIRSADWIVELGPESGEYGGQVVFEGTFSDLQQSDTHTAHYFKTPPPPYLNRAPLRTSWRFTMPACTTSKTSLFGFPCRLFLW